MTRDSRSLIAAAATAEFSAHGYAGARMARIAQRAGVNKQLLFYYFGSKDGLYQEIVSRVASDETPAPPSSLGTGAPRLRTVLHAVFERLHSSPEVMNLLFRDARSSGELARSAFERYVAEIRSAISEGQGLGHYRDDADPGLIARQAIALAVGYFTLGNGTGGPDDRSAWLDGMCETLGRSLDW